MIRVVVAVVLTVGLLAVSLPALDAARADRATARIERFGHRLSVAATDLADSETPVRPVVAGARRVVGVTLPRGRVTVASITSLAVRCHPAGDLELGFAVGDQHRTLRVPVPVPVAVHGRRRISATERPKVRLTFDRLPTGPAVVVHSTAIADRSAPGATQSEGSTPETGPPTPCSASTSRDSTPQNEDSPAPVPSRSKPPP